MRLWIEKLTLPLLIDSGATTLFVITNVASASFCYANDATITIIVIITTSTTVLIPIGIIIMIDGSCNKL